VPFKIELIGIRPMQTPMKF